MFDISRHQLIISSHHGSNNQWIMCQPYRSQHQTHMCYVERKNTMRPRAISSASVCRSCDVLPLRFVVFDQAVCSSLVPRLQRFIPFSWSWVARGSASSEVLLGNAARCTPRTLGSQLRTHRTVALCARSRRKGAKRTASARSKPQLNRILSPFNPIEFTYKHSNICNSRRPCP